MCRYPPKLFTIDGLLVEELLFRLDEWLELFKLVSFDKILVDGL